MNPTDDTQNLRRARHAALSPGKGNVIVLLCVFMSLLSIAGGIIGAALFSTVPVQDSAGGISLERSDVLTVCWVIGGGMLAVLWYVHSGIGTALRWLEFAYARHNE